MNLNEKEVEFIKKHIKNAEELLLEGNENKLIDELHDLTLNHMDENYDVDNDGLVAESIMDKIAFED